LRLSVVVFLLREVEKGVHNPRPLLEKQVQIVHRQSPLNVDQHVGTLVLLVLHVALHDFQQLYKLVRTVIGMVVSEQIYQLFRGLFKVIRNPQQDFIGLKLFLFRGEDVFYLKNYLVHRVLKIVGESVSAQLL